MLKEGEFMCSDLVRLKLSTGGEVVAHLESISPDGCSVTLDRAVPVESIVALQCLHCPKGTPGCFECKMIGAVTFQMDDPPLGVSATIRFIAETWCPERWQPRHLLRTPARAGS